MTKLADVHQPHPHEHGPWEYVLCKCGMMYWWKHWKVHTTCRSS